MIRHLNTVWLTLCVVVLVTLLINPDLLNRNNISEFLNSLGPTAFGVYLLLCLSRALLFIPVTPFILGGAIAFSDQPELVVATSMLGILVGGFLVYRFPRLGSYDEYLESKYPKLTARIAGHMHAPYAFWIVAGWSFFPLVPTDLVCYVAGISKMRFARLASGLFIGSLPMNILYVYSGAEFGLWLRG